MADRGAELLDLLNLGPQAAAQGGGVRPTREPDVRLPRWKSAASSILWTAGILCIVPQGLVPIGFNLAGVDPQVKVWFAARYLPQHLQIPVAVGFITAGALAIWGATSFRRSHARRRWR